MVATRRLNLGPPIPASPARLKANPAKSSYIHAWLADFPSEGISNKAGELATKLASIGYDSDGQIFYLRVQAWAPIGPVTDPAVQALGVPTLQAGYVGG